MQSCPRPSIAVLPTWTSLGLCMCTALVKTLPVLICRCYRLLPGKSRQQYSKEWKWLLWWEGATTSEGLLHMKGSTGPQQIMWACWRHV